MERPTKKCERCKEDFEPTGNSQKFCESCRKKAKIERTKKWRDRTREIVKKAEEAKAPAGFPILVVPPAVETFLAGLVPELRNQILIAARKDAIREMVAHIQANFLEG